MRLCHRAELRYRRDAIAFRQRPRFREIGQRLRVDLNLAGRRGQRIGHGVGAEISKRQALFVCRDTLVDDPHLFRHRPFRQVRAFFADLLIVHFCPLRLRPPFGVLLAQAQMTGDIGTNVVGATHFPHRRDRFL